MNDQPRCAETVRVEHVDDDRDFCDLANRVLAAENPDVTFTEAEDLNRLTAGNGYRDVSNEIDYEDVVCATADELRRRLR